MHAAFGLLLLCQWLAGRSAATRPAAPSPPAAAPVVGFTVGRRAGTDRYHFENASSFDTTTPVPHDVDQRYDLASTWLTGTVAWEVGHTTFSTSAGVTPTVTTPGSDVDTFFDPSGDVITSGTSGSVQLHAWEVAERLGLSRWHGWTVGVALVYSRSAANFLPADIIVTHTIPPSTASAFTTAPETTLAQQFDSGFTADRLFAAGRWQLTVDLDLLPLTHAWLATSLPDKYAQPVTASAAGLSAFGRATVAWRAGRLQYGVAGDLRGAWGYEQSAAYRTRSGDIAIFVGVAR